eukprot:TRINITY_DN23438_c0_g1_i1.p2 TRINITY_DN23438_c0_g1~~TRINITY_DN23438_c0_g1_i1.p2  ORF type:complete len:117 (-),score=22.87 TRINITY_DN23438_c0_g1_i1:200-550(-)
MWVKPAGSMCLSCSEGSGLRDFCSCGAVRETPWVMGERDRGVPVGVRPWRDWIRGGTEMGETLVGVARGEVNLGGTLPADEEEGLLWKSRRPRGEMTGLDVLEGEFGSPMHAAHAT